MTAAVPLVERLAEAVREFWATDADDRDAECIRTAPESIETSQEYARVLLPVVNREIAAARRDALWEAADAARVLIEAGDLIDESWDNGYHCAVREIVIDLWRRAAQPRRLGHAGYSACDKGQL